MLVYQAAGVEFEQGLCGDQPGTFPCKSSEYCSIQADLSVDRACGDIFVLWHTKHFAGPFFRWFLVHEGAQVKRR
jgi:hypothetical protein